MCSGLCSFGSLFDDEMLLCLSIDDRIMVLTFVSNSKAEMLLLERVRSKQISGKNHILPSYYSEIYALSCYLKTCCSSHSCLRLSNTASPISGLVSVMSHHVRVSS